MQPQFCVTERTGSAEGVGGTGAGETPSKTEAEKIFEKEGTDRVSMQSSHFPCFPALFLHRGALTWKKTVAAASRRMLMGRQWVEPSMDLWAPDMSLAIPTEITRLRSLPHPTLVYCFHSPDKPLLRTEPESGLCFGSEIYIPSFFVVRRSLVHAELEKRQNQVLIKSASNSERDLGMETDPRGVLITPNKSLLLVLGTMKAPFCGTLIEGTD